MQTTEEEHFIINISKNDKSSKKSIALHNTRIDYQFRPETETLNKICLYDFIANYELEKVKTNSESKRPTALLDRFKLHPQHPLVVTHILKMRSYKTPVLIGPQIPNKNRNDVKERYARAILTLFYPWRTIDNLISSNQNWEAALNEKYNQIPMNLTQKIDNIQLLHESKLNVNEKMKQKLQSDLESLSNDAKLERIRLYENVNDDGNYEDSFVDYLNKNTIIDDISNVKNKFNQYIQDANNATAKLLKFKESKSNTNFNFHTVYYLQKNFFSEFQNTHIFLVSIKTLFFQKTKLISLLQINILKNKWNRTLSY